MKRVVIVQADTNDGDYVTQETELKGWSAEQLPIIEKVAEAIKAQNQKDRWGSNWQRHNHAKNDNPPEEMYADVLTEEEIDIFDDGFKPSHEDGIHTIESIRILEIANEIKLL